MANKSKGRRRRYSNDGDSSRDEDGCSPAVRRYTGKTSEDDSTKVITTKTTTSIETTTQANIIDNNVSKACSNQTESVIPSKLSKDIETISYFGLEKSEFTQAFTSVIQEISSQGDNIPVEAQQKTQFHTIHPPNISLSKYMERIIKFAFCSAECYILSLVYMDRLVQSNPHFVISSLSIHRLLITSIMVAAKFFDDKFYSNEYYAKIGGIEKDEINKLEIEFLYMINFSLHFQPPEFEQYKEEFVVLPALERRQELASKQFHTSLYDDDCECEESSREESCVVNDLKLQKELPRYVSSAPNSLTPISGLPTLAAY